MQQHPDAATERRIAELRDELTAAGDPPPYLVDPSAQLDATYPSCRDLGDGSLAPPPPPAPHILRVTVDPSGHADIDATVARDRVAYWLRYIADQLDAEAAGGAQGGR